MKERHSAHRTHPVMLRVVAGVLLAAALGLCGARAESLSYDQIMRTPSAYVGNSLTIEGKVIQVIDDGLGFRINVTRDAHGIWTNTVLITRSKTSEPRIIDGDVIRITGTYEGVTSYRAVLGQTIHVPHVRATKIEWPGTPGDPKSIENPYFRPSRSK